MAIKALIFDFGGVVMRTKGNGPRRYWKERLGMDEWDLARLVFGNPVADRAMIGQATDAEAWDYVRAELGISEVEVNDVRDFFFSGDRIDLTLTDFVTARRGRYRTAILSNAWLSARQLFGLYPAVQEAVEIWVISAEEGVAKPDAKIYQRTLARLAVEPSEAVFVDDFEENADAAQALGMHAIHFQSDTDIAVEMTKLGVK